MKDIINRFGGEMLRFAIVGVLAVAIQYGVYLLLVWLWAGGTKATPAGGGVEGALIANSVAYLVSFLFNYAASTRYTFRVKSTVRRGAGFTLAHIINYLLQTLLLTIFLWLALPKPLAMLPVFAICVPVNFLLVRFFLKVNSNSSRQ